MSVTTVAIDKDDNTALKLYERGILKKGCKVKFRLSSIAGFVRVEDAFIHAARPGELENDWLVVIVCGKQYDSAWIDMVEYKAGLGPIAGQTVKCDHVSKCGWSSCKFNSAKEPREIGVCQHTKDTIQLSFAREIADKCSESALLCDHAEIDFDKFSKSYREPISLFKSCNTCTSDRGNCGKCENHANHDQQLLKELDKHGL